MDTAPLLGHRKEPSPSSAKKPSKIGIAMPSASQHKYLVGVALLLTVVILWTFSSFITSDLLGGGYDKPFLITYLNTSAFSFYLLPSWLKRWRKHSRADVETTHYEPIPAASPPDPTTSLRRSNSLIRSLSPSPALNLHSHSPHASTAHSTLIPLPPIDEDFAVPSNDARSGRRRTSGESQRGRGRRRPSQDHHHHHSRPSESSSTQAEPGLEAQSTLAPNLRAGVQTQKLSSTETAKLAAVFCFAWFAANWSLNLSLGFTSVGSSTVLAGMSGFFTLGLGRIIGVESFSRAKVLAVCASFVGLLLVTQSDSRLATSNVLIEPIPSLLSHPSANNGDVSSLYPYIITAPDAVPITLPPIAVDPKNPVLGDMLALLSALFYSIYVILLKVKIGDEENIDMQLFFGFVGLFNTLFLLPVVPILHFTGIETFELPSGGADLSVCAINMLITLSSDYLYVLAMLRTSPLVVTVGLSLTIPFAMAGDFLRGSSATITIQSLIGSIFVITGFLLMGAEGWEEGMNPRVAEGEMAGSEFALEDEDEIVDDDVVEAGQEVPVDLDGRGKSRLQQA